MAMESKLTRYFITLKNNETGRIITRQVSGRNAFAAADSAEDMYRGYTAEDAKRVGERENRFPTMLGN